MRKLGCQPAARRIEREHRRRRGLAVAARDRDRRAGGDDRARSASARRSTGMPAPCAATTSGLLSGIAVEIDHRVELGRHVVGGVADVRGDAEQPRGARAGATRGGRSRSRGDPCAPRTVAIALMPAPPDADDVHRARRGRDRGRGRAPVHRARGDLLDEVGEAGGGVRPPSARAASPMAASRSGSASSAVELGVEAGRRRGRRRRTTTAAPTAASACAFAGLVVAGRAGERHQHRGHPDRGELGDHARPARQTTSAASV